MKYRTIVADPPWPIVWTGGNRKAGSSSGSTRVHAKRALAYPTMTIDALVDLPVSELAHADAHLFLWAVDRFLIDGSAQRVARAWGFEPLPWFIVWRKANAGLGRYVRPAHELILVARRGDARLNECAFPSVRDWKQPYENGAKKHSAKPDGAIDDIERLSDGPYLELFARTQRLGWDTWGDEAFEHVDLNHRGSCRIHYAEHVCTCRELVS